MHRLEADSQELFHLDQMGDSIPVLHSKHLLSFQSLLGLHYQVLYKQIQIEKFNTAAFANNDMISCYEMLE